MPQSEDHRPLDVAIAMFDFGPSGVVRNALRIAAACHKAGLTIELWVAQDSGTLRAEVPQHVSVRAFGAPLGTRYSRGDRRRAGQATVPALAAMLREQRPRVLLSAGNHFHSFAADSVRLLDVPTRLLLRISTGLPRPEQKYNPYRWLRYHYKRRKAERRHEGAARLIAVSEEIARELRRSTDVRADQLVVIPNGIDREAVERGARQPLDHLWFEADAPPVVLGVGRIDKFKNFELLIEAFARLRAERPLRLMILGEERNAWRHRLEALAEKLGVAADIRFEGFQPNPHPYFRRAAAYVCCSRYEGMSNAMLEAMANGCPVVATRTATGAAELLEEGRLGPLAEKGVSALAAALRSRLAQPRGSEELMKRAACYDLQATIDAYVRLLAKEAGREPRSAAAAEGASGSACPLAA